MIYITLAIVCLLSYLIGAIPFAYILVKLFKGIDLRNVGSGNVGTTNATRVLGWKKGVLVFILDILKGALPVFITTIIFDDKVLFTGSPNLAPILAGMAAICGHIWTLFLRFKGGKGVATSAGVFLVLLPIPFLIIFFLFFISVWISKYVSLGSISAAAAFPVLTFVLNPNWDLRIVTILIAILVIVKHRSNIIRLINGEENRICLKNTN